MRKSTRTFLILSIVLLIFAVIGLWGKTVPEIINILRTESFEAIFIFWFFVLLDIIVPGKKIFGGN